MKKKRKMLKEEVRVVYTVHQTTTAPNAHLVRMVEHFVDELNLQFGGSVAIYPQEVRDYVGSINDYVPDDGNPVPLIDRLKDAAGERQDKIDERREFLREH